MTLSLCQYYLEKFQSQVGASPQACLATSPVTVGVATVLRLAAKADPEHKYVQCTTPAPPGRGGRGMTDTWEAYF